MPFSFTLGVILSLLLSSTSALATAEGNTSVRFLDQIRVLGVRDAAGEVTVRDPQGKSRVWKEGDRVEEENAFIKDITRSTIVLTRGGTGEDYESLIVIRFDASGKVKVREYSKQSDSPQPLTPVPDSMD
jgi:type II secretory pathway component PulC